VTKEEKLLAAMLNANKELLDVFKCYNELEAAANAEQERIIAQRDRAEQRADATVRAFRSRSIHLTSLQHTQYISSEDVPISGPTQAQLYNDGGGASTSSRGASPPSGVGRPSYSRDEGSIDPEEKDKGWARGFFGGSREKEREKETNKELTQMIGGC
jgi:hypothetical protein